MIEANLVNNLFDFLPKSNKLLYHTDEERVNIIKNSKVRLNSDHSYYYLCKSIIDLFCERLSSKDQDYSWTIKDYYKIKGYLSKIRNNQLQYLEDTIITLFKTDNITIAEELANFSKIVNWYPEKIKIKEDNSYVFKDTQIEVTDIFLVSTRIVSFMQRSINKVAKDLIETKTDFDTICELIKEIRDDKKRSEINLEQFDKEYSFLESFPLFKNIYLKVRNNYFNILLEALRILHNKQNLDKLTENYRKNYLAKLERRKEKKTIYDKKRRTNY